MPGWSKVPNRRSADTRVLSLSDQGNVGFMRVPSRWSRVCGVIEGAVNTAALWATACGSNDMCCVHRQ
jgi:hypothetical protein